jgi:hypothetical protein
MNTINDVVVSEAPRDVVLFLTKGESGISYPRLDGLYNRNDWVNILNNLELLKLVSHMVSEGLIIDSGKALIKGPNWKEPAFVTEKKYTFE